jgi:alkaline phosphatase D
MTIHKSTSSRRRFLKQIGYTGGFALAPAIVSKIGGWDLSASVSTLFTLGVASGDPSADSVVLWTRLAPDPLNGGGMGTKPVDVRWDVAVDPAMAGVIRSGQATAHPKNGHAVSVNVGI